MINVQPLVGIKSLPTFGRRSLDSSVTFGSPVGLDEKSGLKPTVHEALHPTTASSLIFHSPSVTIHLVGLSLTFT